MSTPTTSARVFLVRHGETDWITGGKFASRTDVPLSNIGERDVEMIRQRLIAENEMIDPTGVAKMFVFTLH
jgi:broad specificity phosphatase PhoE